MLVPSEFLVQAQRAATETLSDLVLLCAIGKHETDFGALGAGREGYTLGYGYPAPGQGNPRFQGVVNQLHYAGKQITAYMGARALGCTTFNDLNAFAINSWKAGDPNWQKGVWSWYQAILPELLPALKEVVKVAIVVYFGCDDMILAKRVATKIGGVIAERSFVIPAGSTVYAVGGPAIGGAVNLTGPDWEDTADAVIKFLRG
jgi:hypothetical protein